MKLFKQRKAKLYDGTVVKEGDKVSFIDPYGKKHIGIIERNFDNGKLFFWNINFKIESYKNAIKVGRKKVLKKKKEVDKDIRESLKKSVSETIKKYDMERIRKALYLE